MRSYSPTALQNYAACPYKFFLQAIHRLAPREIPEAIDELDPLQRGSLIHEIQFELFERLTAANLLPVSRQNLERVGNILDEVIGEVAHQFYSDLAPAIDRVSDDGIDSTRVDLREWLRRASEDDSGYVPWRFELSFGLAGSGAQRRQADPHPWISKPEKLSLRWLQSSGRHLTSRFSRRRRPHGNVRGVTIDRFVVRTRSSERVANRRSQSHRSSSCGTCHDCPESRISRCEGKAPNSN
jgi:hypothetical protein